MKMKTSLSRHVNTSYITSKFPQISINNCKVIKLSKGLRNRITEI